jgi:hypothetical protein
MKRNPNYLLRRVGGKLLLVPIGRQVAVSNQIVILNESAHLLWELLEHEHSLNDLAVALAGEFGLSGELALADVRAFVRDNAVILAGTVST